MGELLENIKSPDDLKKLHISELKKLSQEIRDFLLKSVSVTGGHLASNLGVVELTLALHKVFNTPFDKIVWDVGHQAYVHKIITGRKDRFNTLRKLDGLAGFPKVSESIHDSFNAGHSSTSISAAIGMAKARDIKNGSNNVIAVIGDGALTGGLAYEALNDAGHYKGNLIIILNDNEMSISNNVGGISRYLSRISSVSTYKKVKYDIDSFLSKIPFIGPKIVSFIRKIKMILKYILIKGVFFEELGLKYVGPVDGHNIKDIIKVLESVKNTNRPIILHVKTKKGKGYKLAEENPDKFHGIGPFDIKTGELVKKGTKTYSDLFGEIICQEAKENRNIVAITAAMPGGTGLINFMSLYPERCFDVGIAEGHAVTMAAGLAISGLKPVVAVYSSFLQRAYDQILHDVALMGLNVVFAIDRAGAVGEDGETHQGIYDIGYLSHIPGMTVLAPSSQSEMKLAFKYAFSENSGPVAVRYPKTACSDILTGMSYERFIKGKAKSVKEGRDLTIISAGPCLLQAAEVSKILEVKGISCEIIDIRFVKPLDEEKIVNSYKKTLKMITIEDNCLTGGIGQQIKQIKGIEKFGGSIRIFAFPDVPLIQGTRDELILYYGLDAKSIADAVRKEFNV